MAEGEESIVQLPESPISEARPVDYYVSLARSTHPRIQAARARVAAASQRVPQAESLEDPLLTNSFYPISDQALQTAAGRAGNTLSVSQKYPWPEKRWTKGEIASRETQIAASMLEKTELEIEESVKLAYYELWFVQRAISINEKNREIAVELITLAKARNQAGGSQQDVLRAELQVDNIDDQLIQLRQRKGLAQADLAALIQQPAAEGIVAVDQLDSSSTYDEVDALFAAAAECSPKLRELRWAVSRDREKQKLACLNTRPDFVLGAGWQSITETDAVSPVANGRDNVNFMVGVTLPVWRDRIDASIREASAAVSASSREYDAARDDTYREIRRLTEQVYAASEQLRLYNERILPRARTALQLASADYRGRLVDFGEVTDDFSDVLMIELQVARAEATLAGAMAQLHRTVGCEVSLPAQL
ncbi:Outer membrane efflux protein [Aeoliella mucimassa]|uniref:Outer membrane efflux protein n=2 Tax=Aeoliella mucimassa TaxID=2527972 RepID=A0A518AT99_9BACT|nr:Outer membrane efflux protein [Aeoliella mucimassa]